jgi:2-dehydropantoate 2-reductase
MRICILGAGAIGSVVGGFLQQSGHDVTLLGRARHLETIDRDGLRISGIWGEHTIHGLTTCTRLEEVAARGPFDYVLVTVKAYDTGTMVSEARELIAETPYVCAYQNGLGNAEQLSAVAGPERTLCARAIYGAVTDAPGRVRVTVIASPTAIGVYDPDARNTENDGASRTLAEAMNVAGLPTVFSDRVRTVLWAKVAYNCMLNPLSALLDVPYGALAESADSRALMEAVLEEFYAVGHAEGVALESESAAAYREAFYGQMLPPTAKHYASMREDLRHQRRTEIDALNGAVAALGERHGIACPANRFLTRMIRAHEVLKGGGTG